MDKLENYCIKLISSLDECITILKRHQVMERIAILEASPAAGGTKWKSLVSSLTWESMMTLQNYGPDP